MNDASPHGAVPSVAIPFATVSSADRPRPATSLGHRCSDRRIGNGIGRSRCGASGDAPPSGCADHQLRIPLIGATAIGITVYRHPPPATRVGVKEVGPLRQPDGQA